MSNTQMIQAMFNHLTQSYSIEDARDILVQKYPDSFDEINAMTVAEGSDELVERAAPVEMEVELKPAKVKKETKPKAAAKPVEAKAAKPVETKAKVAKPAAAKKEAKPKVAKKEAAKKETKVDIARKLYSESKDKSRAAMITIFQDKLKMSKAAASTYYYMVKA